MNLTIENLENELKQNRIEAMYLFYGEEKFLLESCEKKIRKNFGELLEGINYIKLDETNYHQLISNLETPAFGYEKKLVIVRNSGLFKKETKKKESGIQETAKRIASYIQENIEQIKQTILLLFIEQEVDKNELYETIEKNGIVCNFELQRIDRLLKRIKAICNGYKVGIDEPTTRYFIETCGTNLQDLINELRKLIEYVGENGIIKKEDIDLLSTKQIDSVIFDLTDCLGKKNIKQALEVFHNLLYSKEPIQRILIMLYNHFKKIYFTKLALKENKNIAEVLNLKPNQAFLASKYSGQAKVFGEQELREILEALVNLDKDSKVGEIDLQVGLESIVCYYCS